MASEGLPEGAAFGMIRPVLNVDLPGIVYAIDARARTRNGEFARFVVAPDREEPRSGLHALLSAVLPITPHAHTWLAEEHWRLLGLAQARSRPGAQAWDLTYLATVVPSASQPLVVDPDDVLLELVQYALNIALTRGVLRFFTRVEDDASEQEVFTRLGFQRYAREATYCLPSAADGLDALAAGALGTLDTLTGEHAAPQGGRLTLVAPRRSDVLAQRAEVPLRRWHRHDAWGLMRLYTASTPHLVQVAEGLTSDELVYTRAGGGRTWTLPLVEPACEAFVLDRGVRLGGWIRLRYGRGSQPHMLSLLAHPDDDGVATELLRFGLELLRQKPPRAIVCQVRDYESPVVNALRSAGFEQIASHALLIRHLAARISRAREAHVTEPRVVYGVKGFGTSPARLSEGEKTYYARDTERRS